MQQSEAAGLTNLPVRRTGLIGREGDAAAVRELVLHAEGHLVTLTGTGGCGKTVLALAVARGLVTDFPDGAWLVQFAPMVDPALVPRAVASAFGVREGADRPLLAGLLAFL